MNVKGYVKLTHENKCSTVTFFHPKSNSLPQDILDQLAKAIEQAGKEPHTSVVLLRSDGERAFCAGASFDELAAIRTKEQGKAFFMGFSKVIWAMRQCPKFILSLIHGKAVGGGVGLIAASDIAVASHKSSVKLSELALGIGPFVVGPAIERKIGTGAFSSMAMQPNQWFSSEWALNQCLYNEIVPYDQLDNAIQNHIQQFSIYSMDAMRNLKKILWHNTDAWKNIMEERAMLSGTLVLSAQAQNTIKSIHKSLK